MRRGALFSAERGRLSTGRRPQRRSCGVPGVVAGGRQICDLRELAWYKRVLKDGCPDIDRQKLHARRSPMRRFALSARYLPAVVSVLLGACAQQSLVMRPPPPQLARIDSQVEMITPEAEPDEVDRMADVQGDRPLPAPGGALERIDCKVGTEDLQARMAVEARGGQIASFAYYSKWRPRTCSFDMQRDDPATKWRLTADGATRVQTPHGSFLIRVLADAYEFRFVDVERQKFCGMDGYTNGTMTIKRQRANPECAVAGLLDREGSAQMMADAPSPPAATPDAAPRRVQTACREASAELCAGAAFYPAAVGF